MLLCDVNDAWTQFLEFAKKRCSSIAFENWLAPIKLLDSNNDIIILEVPNVFVQEYLLSNYKTDLCAFLPIKPDGEPSIQFVVAGPVKKAPPVFISTEKKTEVFSGEALIKETQRYEIKLNQNYRFATFIEGTSNQFVKSAALGIANRPGHSYNPLFIHAGVGLGKTHILHSIGHHVKENHKKLKVQCITTEGFINDLVDSLRTKSIDRMKRFYRSDIDVLLVDDIQFLQNRLNFEEEFCNTFETLINQNKQIVVVSDKPPAQLKLSERMVARMEWGLVAHMDMPEIETRVAILQFKAEQKGLRLHNDIAFYIAEHIENNIRQLEGAVNRLSAHCRLMNIAITQDVVESTLRELLQQAPKQKITVDQILKSVATIFEIRVSDIRGTVRTKKIAIARQLAMYLARELVKEPIVTLGEYFSKTHSTILHAHSSIEKKLEKKSPEDEMLFRRLNMVRRDIGVTAPVA